MTALSARVGAKIKEPATLKEKIHVCKPTPERRSAPRSTKRRKTEATGAGPSRLHQVHSSSLPAHPSRRRDLRGRVQRFPKTGLVVLADSLDQDLADQD